MKRSTGGGSAKDKARPPRQKEARLLARASPRRHRKAPNDESPAPRKTFERASTIAGSRPGNTALYGFQAVREALRQKRRKILGMYATQAVAHRLEAEIAEAQLVPEIVTPEQLSRRLGAGTVHQGVLIEVAPAPPIGLSDIPSHSGIVVVLDQITDPHNVGAIARAAAAFAADAIIMTERHAPEMSAATAKAACGGLEHIAIVRVVNLARALGELGDFGYQRLGFDSEAPLALAEVPAQRPMALVFGAEGKGLRRLSREKCDFLVRLDLPGPIKSLNVSNACAVALALLHAQPPHGPCGVSG
ncbi:MAG TPA: RNA methyltransferase [Methylocella sp.]|nr:RNA methyltransferase [Methylocella sp.]